MTEKRKNEQPAEAKIRRRVEKKFESRAALTQHAVAYLSVNIMLWVIWLLTTRGFPWPMFVTVSWGIGMLSHYLDYYYKHGSGARKREETIEAEVRRQMELEQMQAELKARRAWQDDALDQAEGIELDDDRELASRLSDDGELVDGELIDEDEWLAGRSQH